MLKINQDIFKKVISEKIFETVTEDDIIWGYNYAKLMPENAHPEIILKGHDLLKLSSYMTYFGYEQQQALIDEGDNDYYVFDESVL